MAAAEVDTESSMVTLLRKRFPEPAFVVIPGVRNKAGFDATNECDAFVMGVWPSRGLRLQGCEIKVSRSDWLSEIRKPWKADAFQPYCDFWWLVTAPGIVQTGELPESWGHLERKGRSLAVVKEAPLNVEPRPLSRSMLAAIVKRHGAPDMALQRQIELKLRKDIEASATKSFERERADFAAFATKVREFEAASGLDIRTSYHAGAKLGEVVRLVLQGNVSDRVRFARNDLAKIVEQLDAHLSTSAAMERQS